MPTPQETISEIRVNRSKSEQYRATVRRAIYHLHKTKAHLDLSYANFYDLCYGEFGIGREHAQDIIRQTHTEELMFDRLNAQEYRNLELKHLRALSEIIDQTSNADDTAKIFRVACMLSAKGNPTVAQLWSAARDQGVVVNQKPVGSHIARGRSNVAGYNAEQPL